MALSTINQSSQLTNELWYGHQRNLSFNTKSYCKSGCSYISCIINIAPIPAILWLGPPWSWSYDSWINNYLCYQCLSPLKLWVRTHSCEVYSIQHYIEPMSKTGYIRWNDSVSCVLDHHANSDFYSAGSLKQQSVAMGRHVSQLGHIILIRTNKYMLLLHIAVNSNYQVYTNDAVHTHKYTSESKTLEFSTAIERWASNSRLWYSRF